MLCLHNSAVSFIYLSRVVYITQSYLKHTLKSENVYKTQLCRLDNPAVSLVVYITQSHLKHTLKSENVYKTQLSFI
ncbi:hypothetical protein YC2023_117713 [Brassica napus]